MKGTFVIVSVSDRVHQLNILLESIISSASFKELDICLCYQDYLGNQELIKYRSHYATLLIEPKRMGCDGARIHLLNNIQYDYYINLDDDMELIAATNYEQSIKKAFEPGTGFVLTNWARNHATAEVKARKMRKEFVKQILVYQGGGMVYADKIAALIRMLPIKKTTFDNAWALTAYLHGYTNYRYLGSVAVHKICGQGGMKSFMMEESTELTYEEYINYRYGKRRTGTAWDICIPLDGDIKQNAHDKHIMNKKK